MPSLVLCANCSVARPSHPASGIIARHARMNVAICDEGQKKCTRIVAGTKISSQLSMSCRTLHYDAAAAHLRNTMRCGAKNGGQKIGSESPDQIFLDPGPDRGAQVI